MAIHWLDVMRETVQEMGLPIPCRDVYAIRHGQTQANIDGIVQGQLDIPLNETGEHEIAEAACLLKTHPIGLIFSGMQKRAVQSAQIISRSLGNIPIKYDARFDDHASGVDGQKIKDVDWNAPREGMEPIEAYTARVVHAFNDVLEENTSSLVVCHRGSLRILEMLMHIKDIGLKEQNASPILFQKNEGLWKAVSLDSRSGQKPAP